VSFIRAASSDVSSTGLAVLAGAFLLNGLGQSAPTDVTLLALFAAAAIGAGFFKIVAPLARSEQSTATASRVVDLAALLALAPAGAMAVALGGGLAEGWREAGAHWTRSLRLAAVRVAAIGGAGLALNAFPSVAVAPASAAGMGSLAIAATVHGVLLTFCLVVSDARTEREHLGRVWLTRMTESASSYALMATIAVAAWWSVEHVGYWATGLFFAPLYMMYRTWVVYAERLEDEQRHVQETSALHLATVEALALAIDAKDHASHSHIRRIQSLAVGLARVVGLGTDDMEAIRTASLLHDIGKLAIPEHILSKPGALTQEEFQKVRIHPQIGADIIATVPFPYPVAPIILSHHERWDGKGYPRGLAGEDIPVGARILTIVDLYDAVTNERPYHRPLSIEGALALMRDEAGRSLDPSLVSVFLRELPRLMAEVDEDERVMGIATRVPETLLGGSTAAGLVPVSAGPSAFDNIAMAHREIYALYEIAQAMGTSLGLEDTMALVSSKLNKVIPWSGSALFLQDPEGDDLHCRFAVGIDAPRLLNASVKVGHGLSGWVARNRRTLINGEPRIAFEAAGVTGETVLQSALVCPLYHAETFFGCLALYHTERNRYSEDHRRLLERVADQAGAVIHNALVFEQTREDSRTDPLTLLPNRRTMQAHFEQEVQRADRVGREVALIVMDVDAFKSINDTYGHHVGDHALRQVAAVLQSSMRPYDVCVRYAGDEFVVVLGQCSRADAEAKCAELQRLVDSIELEVRPGKPMQLAVSAGVAVYPADGDSCEALIAEADGRMYLDKAARRRRLAAAQVVATSAASAAYVLAPNAL
jgi:diguanylate cyclase (GGDEF)-like protein/putative nucleotidyltransferase with HDIG domain